MYRTIPVDKIRYKKDNLTDQTIGETVNFFEETYGGYILPSE